MVIGHSTQKFPTLFYQKIAQTGWQNFNMKWSLESSDLFFTYYSSAFTFQSKVCDGPDHSLHSPVPDHISL